MLKRIPILPTVITLLVVLILVGLSAGTAWAIFVKKSGHPIVRGLSNALPIPAAKLGDRTIYYRDYVKSRDTLRVFLASPAAKEQNLSLTLDAALESNVLEKLIHEAALEELAANRNISVGDEELRAFFADVIASASSTTPDVGLYLLQNFGWNEEDFRQNVLKPALLEQKLGVELANASEGDPNALAIYLEERLQRKDVVRYLRFN